jgi:hypothetical protein
MVPQFLLLQGNPQAFTVPEPFNLATSNIDRATRAAKAQAEQQAAELAECTFRPATKNRERREIIASILAEPYTDEELLALDY